MTKRRFIKARKKVHAAEILFFIFERRIYMAQFTPDGKKIKMFKIKPLEIKNMPLPISTPFIKLDSALKFSGVAETGGHAKMLVEEGSIRVNGVTCLVRGKKLYPGDNFEYRNERFTIEAVTDSNEAE